MIVGGKQKVLSCYRTFLAETLKDSIMDIEELQEFIKQEDVVYRSFLAYLHDYGDRPFGYYPGYRKVLQPGFRCSQ